MEIQGSIIKKAFELRNLPASIIEKKRDPLKAQVKVLKKLVSRAMDTRFGEDHNFYKILYSERIVGCFQENVPIFDYQSLYNKYWYRLLNGERYVTWPGKAKYFALSSGTSEASSKYIPVTNSMLKSIKRASIRQLTSVVRFDFPLSFYDKGMLMIGGSTHLQYNGKYYEGDLSGITAKNIPFWFQHFYKPGKEIAKTTDWKVKLSEIVNEAPKWDISTIVGVPAWVQIILEKIIERYNLKNIHELWPNLKIYVHSGVSVKPYIKRLNELFGEEVFFMESYLASEGYVAYSHKPSYEGMELITDNGIFFEFVKFNDENFDFEGNIKEGAKAVWLGEVEENMEYALLLSTNAGAWRYLIGDTIKFTNKQKGEIIITGRTKHFLSVCGEHLSLDNISRAIELVQNDLNISIPEFTVVAENYGSLFAHRWYIGTNDQVNPNKVKELIDKHLNILNDDYRVERLEAIKDIFVEILPLRTFYGYMESKGKLGAANKFPRVLKGSKLEEWRSYLQKNQ